MFNKSKIRIPTTARSNLCTCHKSIKCLSTCIGAKVMSARIQIRLADFDYASNQLRNPCLRTRSTCTWVEKELIRANTSCSTKVLSDCVHRTEFIMRSICFEKRLDFDGFRLLLGSSFFARKAGSGTNRRSSLVPKDAKTLNIN